MNLTQKISSILEGFKYTRIEDPIREDLARYRASICGTCDFISEGRVFGIGKDDRIKEIKGMKCSVCMCGLSEKLRSKKESCPDNRWSNV